jgi:hypothetical protein
MITEIRLVLITGQSVDGAMVEVEPEVVEVSGVATLTKIQESGEVVVTEISETEVSQP